MLPIAIVYQVQKFLVRDGIIKPLKPGGYSDSGSDITYVLRAKQLPIITHVSDPDPESDTDWVFADTDEGIQQAMSVGAQILW